MKLVLLFILVIIFLMIMKKIVSFIIEKEKEIDNIVLIQEEEFFLDISDVLKKWNIRYEIECDANGEKMMVIVRKKDDPFFAVTTNRIE